MSLLLLLLFVLLLLLLLLFFVVVVLVFVFFGGVCWLLFFVVFFFVFFCFFACFVLFFVLLSVTCLLSFGEYVSLDFYCLKAEFSRPSLTSIGHIPLLRLGQVSWPLPWDCKATLCALVFTWSEYIVQHASPATKGPHFLNVAFLFHSASVSIIQFKTSKLKCCLDWFRSTEFKLCVVVMKAYMYDIVNISFLSTTLTCISGRSLCVPGLDEVFKAGLFSGKSLQLCKI